MAERVQVDDLVVVVPGITGSRLSRDGREVWGASAGAVVNALLTFGRSVKDLRLPEGIGDNDPKDGVTATGVMNDVHVIPGLWTPVRGYTGLVTWLRKTFTLVDAEHAAPESLVNLVVFAYDWRLSNRLSAARLGETALAALDNWRATPGHSEAKLVFLCHSMGGLVARYFLEHLGGAEHTRALVTFGTPHRGSLNALTELVNGHRQGWWKFKVDLTALVRSLPSMYQLLPIYGCIDVGPNSELQMIGDADVSALDASRVEDAVRFHNEIRGPNSGTPAYDFSTVVGIEQPTMASARIRNGMVLPSPEMFTVRDGSRITHVDLGDGTVPRFSAGMREDGAARAPSRAFRSERHGSLHLNAAILDNVRGVLTEREVVYRDVGELARPFLGVDLPDVAPVGSEMVVPIRSNNDRLLLEVILRDEEQSPLRPIPVRNLGEGEYAATFMPPSPGLYEVQVRSPFESVEAPAPVTGAVLAWSPAVEDLE